MAFTLPQWGADATGFGNIPGVKGWRPLPWQPAPALAPAQPQYQAPTIPTPTLSAPVSGGKTSGITIPQGGAPSKTPNYSIAPPYTPGTPSTDTQEQDPLTKFNLALYDMLTKAQTGVNNNPLYGQKNQLQLAQNTLSTGGGFEGLTPSAALNARQNAGNLYNPAITNVVDQIRANNESLTNFEKLLDTANKYGEQAASMITPSKDVIEGYRQMIRAGASPTAIPDSVRNKVLAGLTADDWSAYAAANASTSAADIKILGLDIKTWSAVQSVANQFDGEQIVKQYNALNEANQFVKSLPNDTKSPADDQGLVYSFAKAMDPNSVVREGEYATVQKYSQSWLSSFGFNAQRVIDNSQFLTPSARSLMKNTIDKKYQASLGNYKNVYDNYIRRIDAIAGQPGIGQQVLTNYSGAYGANGGGAEDPLGILQFLGRVGGDTNTATAMRTDRNNNPTAFTTDLAKQAGLVLGKDYVVGDKFPTGNLYTARLVGDPVATTIKLIDKVGFLTASGQPRWTYANIPQSQWNRLTYDQKKSVVQQMYQREGNQGALNTYFA